VLDGETLDVQPLVDTDESGIHATFLDGARISLTVGGRTACSKCGYGECEHFCAAIPFYEVWLQEQAASGRWPAWKLEQLGVGKKSNRIQSHQSEQEATMPEETAPDWGEIKKNLAAPFDSYYVGWKAQATNHEKTRALAVAYIDARTVMDRLDAIVGAGNWSDSYRVISDGNGEFAVECTLTVHGVHKSDVGTADEEDDGATAPRPKSAYSDALKRAAVKWGIGRYLYRLPSRWVDYDAARKLLAETPELPDWALPAGERRDDSPGRSPAPSGSGPTKTISPKGDLDKARAVILPFGTRSHPDWKGKTLGELPGEFIAWLVSDFAPSSDEGREVKSAAATLRAAA
jgi:hypothetical protein